MSLGLQAINFIKKQMTLRRGLSFSLVSFFFLISFAQMPTTSFWRRRLAFLAFTTSAQSVLASLCSGVATVQTRNASNIATNVSSNLTVNLSTVSGLTYYSDSDCTIPITNLTIASGTNSANFYFLSTASGSVTVDASATNYMTASQTETIGTNNFVWTGGGGNSAWSTGANWFGGTPPNSSQVAVFNSSCSSNCSPTLTANMSVGGVRINPGYSGTITQGNYTITVASGGWVQTSGTFVGSTTGQSLLITSNFLLHSGSFQTTTGSFTIMNPGNYGPIAYKIVSGATLTHSAGSTIFFETSCAVTSITFGSGTYNNVTINNPGGCPVVNISDSTVTVNGDLTLGRPAYGGNLNGGTFLVGGNFSMTGSESWTGSATVRLTGNASGQTVTSTSNATVPNLEIAAGANPVTLVGVIGVARTYTLTSVGTFTTTGSTLNLVGNCDSSTITPGTVTYNDVSFSSQCHTYSLGGGTMTVAGNLTFTKPGYNAGLNSGTINVGGNVSVTGSPGWGGSAVVRLTGNASGQSIVSASNGGIPNLTFATGTNNVTISGNLETGNLITSSLGTLTATGSTLSVRGPTVTVGSESYNNVNFGGGCVNLTLTGTMKIVGNVSFLDYCMGQIDSGTLVVGGNLTSTQWNGGSAKLTLNGATQQTITQVNSYGYFPNGGTTLSNLAGLTLATNVNLSGHTVTVTAGDITMNGKNLSLVGLALGGNSVTRSAGVLTVNGSVVPAGTQSLYGGTINP